MCCVPDGLLSGYILHGAIRLMFWIGYGSEGVDPIRPAERNDTVGTRFRRCPYRRHVEGMGPHLQRTVVPNLRLAIWNPSVLWSCCWWSCYQSMGYDWRIFTHRGFSRYANERAKEYCRNRFRRPDQASIYPFAGLLGRPDSLLPDAG